MTNSALSGNSAKDDGAGIYNSGGTVTVTNSTLSGNSTYYWGGGICNSHGGTLTVTNSTFLGNSSSNYDGGGIYSSGTLSVTNAILSGNSAKRFGGGIYSSGTVTVTDSTLSGNSATSHGGGIYNAGPLTLRNSILWRNSNTDLGGSGSVTNARNLIGAEPSFVRNPWNGGDGWRDDPATTTVDESANNDYGDLHLTNDSLAINYGDNSLLPLDTQDLDQDGVTDEPIPLDRDGKPRVFGEVVDCGAFEFQEVVVVRETPSVVVTSASDTLDLFDQQTSLREAIYNAGTGDLGTIVTFDPTLDGATITLGGSALSLDTSLTIDASALQSLTVDADGSSRVFDVTGNHVVLDSLTILGGHSDNGGGIYNSGTLTVRNSTLTGNSASSSGGGIFNAGTLLLTDVTVSENSSASRGGGIYSYGTLTVANSIFSANTGSDGGAICFSGALVLTNSVLSGNSATNAGGGIYSDNATLSVMNSTLAGNSASSGGGIFSDLGTLAVTNSVLSGNSAGSGGGIWNASGVLTVTNATISGNFVLYVGGGIGSYSGTVSVINSMLVGNSAADSGGGIYSSGKLSVTNSTLAGNSGGSTGAITNADLLTLSNSILWQNSGDELGGSGGLTSNSNLIGIDPSFVRNPSDGGDGWRDDPSTTDVDESANNDYGDLHLTKHSLAINAGDNSLLPLDTQDLDRDGVTAEPIPLDRDGSVRVYDVTVDCGAFEFHPRQNPVLPEDVNADGQVTPLDVLLVINYLNANAAQKLLLNPSDSQPPYFDVTGDDQITPQDVLAVIQCLNDQAWPSGEGEAGSEYVLPVVAEAPFATVRSRPLGDRNSSHVDRLELTELVADGQLDDVLSDIAGDVLGQWSPQAATWKTWP
ncbi:MAG: dockerin type I domain-containing protein [Planctomycetota bacterium]|nr:dockerin type I domain-containing protein [Planctomycetota bacterium]